MRSCFSLKVNYQTFDRVHFSPKNLVPGNLRSGAPRNSPGGSPGGTLLMGITTPKESIAQRRALWKSCMSVMNLRLPISTTTILSMLSSSQPNLFAIFPKLSVSLRFPSNIFLPFFSCITICITVFSPVPTEQNAWHL